MSSVKWRCKLSLRTCALNFAYFGSQSSTRNTLDCDQSNVYASFVIFTLDVRTLWLSDSVIRIGVARADGGGGGWTV